METFKLIVRFTALLICCLKKSSSENVRSHAEMDITQAPWLVSLRYLKIFPHRQHYCTGIILGPNEVLSVARCHKGRTLHLLQVRAGTNDMYISGILHHEDLRQTIYINSRSEIYKDIVFIRVKEPFKFDKKIRPIALADVLPKNGEKIEIVGWKRIRPKERPKIVGMNFTVFNDNQCSTKPADRKICIGEHNWDQVPRKDEAGNSILFNQRLLGLVMGLVLSKDEVTKSDVFLDTNHDSKQKIIVYHSIIPYRDWINKKYNASRARALAEGVNL